MKPPRAVHLSPEIYARFTAYHRRNLAWGVFHVWLDDGNYKIPVPWTGGLDADATAEERELWAIFRQLSPSQMKKLARRCDLPMPSYPSGPPLEVTAVDRTRGTITLSSIVPPPSFEKDDGIEIRARLYTQFPMHYGVFTMPDEPKDPEPGKESAVAMREIAAETKR